MVVKFFCNIMNLLNTFSENCCFITNINGAKLLSVTTLLSFLAHSQQIISSVLLEKKGY